MNKPLKENVTEKSTWLRGFFMLIFAICYGLAEALLFVIVLFQFLASVVTGKPNAQLVPISRAISRYIFDILLYLTYNSEKQSFPFADFPKGDE